MKQFILASLSVSVLFFSCKKDSSSPSGSSSFQATINGTVTNFSVVSATLIHSPSTNQKRFDVTGKSEDGKTLLTLTVGEETATGNGISTGKHEVLLFNDDDPNTPEDESIDSDAYTTLAFYQGSNLITDVYAEKGDITITANDENAHTMSGTFQSTLKSQTEGTDYTITAGTFNNVQYLVAN